MNDGFFNRSVAGRTMFAWTSIVIFPLVFIGLGLLGIRQLIKDQQRGEASVSWPKVRAQIDTVTMNEYATKTTRPRLVVAYLYSYGGRQYGSTRVSFASSSSRKKRGALYAQYKGGGTITVFVNPADPAMAVIEPGRPPLDVALLLFSLLGIVSGLTAGKLLLKKDESEGRQRKVVKRPKTVRRR